MAFGIGKEVGGGMPEIEGGDSRAAFAASDQALRPTQPRFDGARFTALLILTQIPSVAAFTVPVPLLAGMARDLAHDPASAYLVKLVSGVLGPSMAIGAPLAGWLADRFDRRWLLMALAALYTLAGISPYFLENLELIVASRFCTGFAAAGLMAIGLTMVGDYLPEQRRAGMIGMLSALNMVTSLLILPAAGFVGDAGWRLAFLIYLSGAPAIILASPTPLPVPQKPPPATLDSSGAKRWRLDLPYGLLLLALGIGIILTVPAIYVSFHLAGVGLGKVSTVGLLMMLNSMIAAVFSSFFGRASSRYSWRVIFGVGFSTMGAGLILLAYAPGISHAVFALLLMGAGMGWLAPGLMAKAVASVEEGQRGKVVGAVQGASSVAPLIGLTLLEPLLPTIGTRGVLLIVGLLSAGLLLGFLVRGNGARAGIS